MQPTEKELRKSNQKNSFYKHYESNGAYKMQYKHFTEIKPKKKLVYKSGRLK